MIRRREMEREDEKEIESEEKPSKRQRRLEVQEKENWNDIRSGINSSYPTSFNVLPHSNLSTNSSSIPNSIKLWYPPSSSFQEFTNEYSSPIPITHPHSSIYLPFHSNSTIFQNSSLNNNYSMPLNSTTILNSPSSYEIFLQELQKQFPLLTRSMIEMEIQKIPTFYQQFGNIQYHKSFQTSISNFQDPIITPFSNINNSILPLRILQPSDETNQHQKTNTSLQKQTNQFMILEQPLTVQRKSYKKENR